MKEQIRNVLQKMLSLDMGEDFNVRQLNECMTLNRLSYSLGIIESAEYVDNRDMILAYAKKLHITSKIKYR